jgi:hypothetical protein
MRIRQIALVTRTLEPVVADLCAVFGLEEGFRDPGVGEFGLRNMVLVAGDTFLEVLTPVRDGTTAGRFLDKRGGDGGYMVILQTDDLAADRKRLAALGVRIVWETMLDDIATIHLHPRDVGGAIVSLDQPRPPESWRWGGPDWQAKARTDVVGGITSVTLDAQDPASLAARWAEVFGRRTGDALEITLAPGVLRFVAAGRRDEGIVAVGLAAVDAGRALATARQRGLPTAGRSMQIGGVRFELE